MTVDEDSIRKTISRARRSIRASNQAAEQLEMELVRFKAENSDIEFNLDLSGETVWATQQQIAELFGRDRDTIGHHIEGIYQDAELDRAATTAKFPVVRQEGNRSVRRVVDHYNLDLILSVGYRVNSSKATRFRQWATQTLRSYLVDGHALNERRLRDDATALRRLAAKIALCVDFGQVLSNKGILWNLEAWRHGFTVWINFDDVGNKLLYQWILTQSWKCGLLPIVSEDGSRICFCIRL